MATSRLILACLVSAFAVASPAVAQQGSGAPGTPSQVGSVKSTEGPQGAVIVVRGSQAYALLKGDALFEGDRIVTRSNGVVTISTNNCEKTLQPTTSIVVDDELCNVAPITIASADPVAEVALTPAPPTSVGATPFLLPGLLAAGGTAAALSSSRSTSGVVF